MILLQKLIHNLAREKGWYDGPPRNVGELIALCHSELSEALEEYRKDASPEGLRKVYFREDGKPEGFGVELADCVIRILDMAEFLGLDLGHLVALKHAYNASRSYRHGGKAA